MKFIAIAPRGHEYFYKPSTVLSVPGASAYFIAEHLTKTNYRINEHEVWHVYESEGTEAQGKARKYKNKIVITWK